MPGLERASLVLATLAALAYSPALGAVDCTANGVNLVNNDNLCMCHSSWGGALCGVQHTTPENCASWDDATEMPGEITIGATVADAALAYGAADSITWTATFPISDGRVYTQVKLGDCVDGTDFFTFLSTSTAGECTDKLAVGIKAVDMDNCGFDREAVTYNGKEYWNMSSVLEFTYSDDTAAGGQNFDRDVTAVFAVHALFESRYEATVADIAVYSAFDLQAGITLQAITDGQASSFIEVTYGLSHPYQVHKIKGVLSVAGGTNTAALRTAANGGGTTFTGVEKWTAPECTAGEYNNNDNSCLKTAYVEIMHSDQCTLLGAYTLEDVEIYCLESLSAPDCPLAAMDTESTITFNLDSANFCNGNDEVIIDDAVTIDRFIFVDPENRIRDEPAWSYVDPVSSVVNNKPAANTPIESLLWGGTVFARLDFSGLRVTDATIQATDTKLGAGDYTTIPTNFDFAGTVVPGTDFVVTRSPVQDFTGKCEALGFCIDDQTILIRHTVGSGMHAGLTNDPGLGAFETLTVRLTVDLTYETDKTFASRRRRRQATADGSEPPTRTDGAGAGMIEAPPVAISASNGQTVADTGEDDFDNAAGAAGSSAVLLAVVCVAAGYMSS